MIRLFYSTVRKIARRTIIFLMVFTVALLQAPASVLALDGKYDETFYSNNNILYYDPSECSTTTTNNISVGTDSSSNLLTTGNGIYNITIDNPAGKQFHSHDNSIANIENAHKKNDKSIDIDINKSTDGILFAAHEPRLVGKSWAQVQNQDSDVQTLTDMLTLTTKYGLQANLDIKPWGNKWDDATFAEIANLANNLKAKATIKASTDNKNLSDALHLAQTHGFWVRSNAAPHLGNGWTSGWKSPNTSATSTATNSSAGCCSTSSDGSLSSTSEDIGSGNSGDSFANLHLKPAAIGHLQTILQTLTGTYGLTLAQASGIAGNLKTESASTFDPHIRQGVTFYPDNAMPELNVGFGIAQWTSRGRQLALVQMAKNNHLSTTDLSLQMKFLWTELNSSYKTSTLDKLLNTPQDVREDTKIVMLNYERPKDQSESAQEGRANIGEAIYNHYKGVIQDGSGGGGIGNASASCGTDTTSDDGGIGVANGFTFPLKTTQAVIKKGQDSDGTGSNPKGKAHLVWCYTSTSNCHHDYNAADIFAPTGTQILAVKAGTVLTTHPDDGNCAANTTSGCNITIKGDDGYTYYYAHMIKPAVVHPGQHVSAGQHIGAVGIDKVAEGTIHHLHIDITKGYSGRPSCAGSACNSYHFYNVQQYLVPAFQNLPTGDDAS